MIVTGMKHFENVCRKKLAEWYRKNHPDIQIDEGDIYISSGHARHYRIINALRQQISVVMGYMLNIPTMAIGRNCMRMYTIS